MSRRKKKRDFEKWARYYRKIGHRMAATAGGMRAYKRMMLAWAKRTGRA